MRRRAGGDGGARRTGFTIAETVIALFIVVGAAMASAQMFRTALQSSGLAQDETMALLLCEHRVDEVRAWSRQTDATSPGNPYRFDGAWPDGVNDGDLVDGATPIPAVPGPADTPASPFLAQADADNPQFVVGAQAWRDALYSPAREMPDAVPMTQSARILKVSADWGDAVGAPRGRAVSLVAPVFEPPRRITSLTVTPSGGHVAAAGSVILTATPSDAAGPIGDVVVKYYVAPHNGNATVVAILPNQARLRNGVIYADGKPRQTPGQCGVNARAASDGREWWDKSAIFTLDGVHGTPIPGPFP